VTLTRPFVVHEQSVPTVHVKFHMCAFIQTSAFYTQI